MDKSVDEMTSQAGETAHGIMGSWGWDGHAWLNLAAKESGMRPFYRTAIFPHYRTPLLSAPKT